MTPRGIFGAMRTARSVSTVKVTRSRWLTRRAWRRRAALVPTRVRRAPRRGHRGRGRPQRAWKSANSASSSAAHDQQDGIGAHEACIAHVGGGHGEVLAQHGQRDSRPGRGEVGCRPAEMVHVGDTDRHAAPPRSYDAASAVASRSASIAPLDGDRRFTSAITPKPADSAAANPRAGAAPRAWSRSCSSGRRSVAA